MSKKEFIKGIFSEVFRQLFGLQKRRGGKLILTRHTLQKMGEYKVDQEILEGAFRYGIEYNRGKILRKFGRYSVGLYYKTYMLPVNKANQVEETYLITTCWIGR